MTRKILITLLIGTLTQIAFAQTFDKSKLDNYFNALQENNKFMGSVAVSKDGKSFTQNQSGLLTLKIT